MAIILKYVKFSLLLWRITHRSTKIQKKAASAFKLTSKIHLNVLHKLCGSQDMCKKTTKNGKITKIN